MHLRTDTSLNSHFARVPTISHSRNKFSVSEKHVSTCQFDYLFPIYHKFIYPGDTLSVRHEIMARLQTQIGILYDDLYFDVHTWFVPFRLIQENWARFQYNSQPMGPSQDNSALTTPSIDLSGLSSGFASKSLYDYLGYPTLINMTATSEHINNYLARAYNLIWNENYRDENLQNAVVVDLDEGPDDPSDYTLLKRGKRHDMFTSSLTAAQKGAAVTLPLGTSAPVWGSASTQPTGVNSQWNSPVVGAWLDTTGADGTRVGQMRTLFPSGTANSYDALHQDRSGANSTATGNANGSQYSNLVFYDETLSKAAFPNAVAPWYADLAAATAATVNQWRQSIAIQHLLEADARGGTRDIESIKHRWGVTVPDFRLSRPEYLGGTTFTFDGRVVPQTSESATTPQGTLVQFSETLSGLNVTHSFVEGGVYLVLLSLRSNITYQQGLPRELSHRTRYDFYQPEFANLGEVSLLAKEIMFQAGTTTNNTTFGFQEYGYWLRYGMNRVSAEMRSNYPQSLDSRHMADDYSVLPTLSAAWIQSDTPISRNIVVDTATADPVELNMLTSGSIARTLPMYSVPGLYRL